MKTKMLVMIPFTGLGLYNGFRGNRWLRNRIKVFETFVIPSLLNQSDRDFIVWVAWRREERDNPHVIALLERMEAIPNFKVVFTYTGIPIYDDKYPDTIARERLYRTLKGCMGDLIEAIPDCDEVIMLIQPSDDCYDGFTVESIKTTFKDTTAQAVVFLQGYICDYTTLNVCEYNPTTIPPFAAIRFERNVFTDTVKFINYLGLKKDVGDYKKGTPYPSHEYLADCLHTAFFHGRGFLVGCHGENISTHWNHPFRGSLVEGVLDSFGIRNRQPLALPVSLRKRLMRFLPHRWQRKMRYWFGELLFSRFYTWLRN